jgi:hypothetical protein
MTKWVPYGIEADLTSVANPDPCLFDPWIRDPGRVKNPDADPEPVFPRAIERLDQSHLYRSRA